MATKTTSVVDSPSASAQVLVVTRRPANLSPVWDLAQAHAWQCNTVISPWDALEFVQEGKSLDFVLLDLADEGDGLNALRWLHYVRPSLPVVLIAQSPDHSQQVEALRMGAHGYVTQPFTAKELKQAIEARSQAGSETKDPAAMPELISEAIERFGEDLFFVCTTPAMQKLRVHAESLAQVDAPVLIVGERGSGKESTARLIHQLSIRSGFPFLKIDCAAFPGDLLEAELFGSAAHAGKLELGELGVLYLEEITAMPLPIQAKLLAVMQEKSYIHPGRVNGNGRVRVNTRIIAAIGPDAEAGVVEGKLRRDLYYRLSAFSLHVPSLRQCREGIPLLLAYFMNRLAKQYGLPNRTPSPALLRACEAHCWRGNITELRDFAKRYLVVGDDELALWELKKNAGSAPEWAHEVAWHSPDGQWPQADGLKSLVRDVKGETERNAIANALEETHWNRKAAARLLRISYRTLLYKIQSYGMTPPSLPLLLRNGIKDHQAE